MCLGYPALVLEIDELGATVDDCGRRRRASLLMQPDVPIGAWVLVAAGAVVRQIDANEAAVLAAELNRANQITAGGTG